MEEYKKTYSDKGVWGAYGYGSPVIGVGLKCAVHLQQFGKLKDNKILCVGSGNAYEAVHFKKHGHDVTTLDLYHPDINFLKGVQVRGFAHELPFMDKEFDLYFCCEMMEHLPEELTVPTLKEAMRVSKRVFFTIADTLDVRYNIHINLHSFIYWYELFKDLGFKILNAQYRARIPIMVGQGKTWFIGWSDGMMIHAEC